MGTPAPASAGADWQRPPGLTAANWEYVRSGRIAAEYNQFLAGNPLMQLDGKIVAHYLPRVAPDAERPWVVDFGCGTGRSLWPLVERGYQVLGVDLSLPMLVESVRATRSQEELAHFHRIQANLVELAGLADGVFDTALCLFSTLGMIQGQASRARFLADVHRSLQPGGRLIVHAHSASYHLRHPGGWSWALANGWAALRGREELGDRRASYRGLRNFFIHSFRRGELERDLRRAGLVPHHWWGVVPGDPEPRASDPLPRLSAWRDRGLVGWIVVCYRDDVAPPA